MGIVKISDQMHENLRLAGNALSRSINSQAEHWMRVGMLAEMYPGLGPRDLSRCWCAPSWPVAWTTLAARGGAGQRWQPQPPPAQESSTDGAHRGVPIRSADGW